MLDAARRWEVIDLKYKLKFSAFVFLIDVGASVKETYSFCL